METVSRRVLIADDAAFFRKLLREMLSEAGFEVVAEAKDGREPWTGALKAGHRNSTW